MLILFLLIHVVCEILPFCVTIHPSSIGSLLSHGTLCLQWVFFYVWREEVFNIVIFLVISINQHFLSFTVRWKCEFCFFVIFTLIFMLFCIIIFRMVILRVLISNFLLVCLDMSAFSAFFACCTFRSNSISCLVTTYYTKSLSLLIKAYCYEMPIISYFCTQTLILCSFNFFSSIQKISHF